MRLKRLTFTLIFHIFLSLVFSHSVYSAPTPSISGTVVDDANQPLEGWVVSLSNSSKSKPTDKQGFWAFDQVKAGSYTLTLTLDKGYNYYLPHSGRFQVSLGTKPQSFTFKVTRNGAIAGSVLYQDGTPMKDWTVTLNPQNKTTKTDSQGQWGFTLANNGRYQAVLTVKEDFLAVSPKASSDTPPVVSQTVEVTSNKTVVVDPFVVTAKPAVNISVTAFPSVPLEGWTINLKVKGNDTTIQSVKTGKNGVAVFDGLDFNDYTAVLDIQNGYVPASPASNELDFTVSGPSKQSLEYRLGKTGAIFGTVYQQRATASDMQAESPRLKDWQVYIDQNGNRKLDKDEPISITDSRGAYSFDAVGTGSFSVRLVVQKNWRVSQPLGDSGYTLTIHSRFQEEHKNFGVQQYASLSGVAFNDLNKNGVKDAGESGLGNWEVSVDVEGNTLTAKTDASGAYLIPSIIQGIHKLSVEPTDKTEWEQTSPTQSQLKFDPGYTLFYSGVGQQTELTAFQPAVVLYTSAKLTDGDRPVALRVNGNESMVSGSDGDSYGFSPHTYQIPDRHGNVPKTHIQWQDDFVQYSRSHRQLAVVDLDDDGLLDSLQRYTPDSQLFIIYGNDLDADPVKSGAGPFDSYVIDFITPDRFPDLLLLNANDKTKMQLMTNLGKRQYQFKDISVSEPVMDFTTLDVDRDGNVDLVTLTPKGVYVSKNDGAGDFGTALLTIVPPSDTDSFPSGAEIRTADFNNDNFNDLVISNPDKGTYVYLNNQINGFFFINLIARSTGEPGSLVITDIDNDNLIDVIFPGDDYALIYQNRGHGLFTDVSDTIIDFQAEALQTSPTVRSYLINGTPLPDLVFLSPDENIPTTKNIGRVMNRTTQVAGPVEKGFFAAEQAVIDFGISLQ